MRTITQDPNKVVPNLSECDIYNNLLLVRIEYSHLAFVIKEIDNTFNLYGDQFEKSGDRWGYCGTTSLLEFLQASWYFWHDRCSINNIKIYIISTKKELDTVLCDIEKVQPINLTLKNNIKIAFELIIASRKVIT